MASMREPGALDDDGKVDGYPVEGLCLAVLDDGRARPAWLCRKEDNRQGRLKVLIYGDASGKARTLLSSERIDALPSTDEALAARLQGDWKNASTQERDELLRGCDEIEARRAAPPQFLDMVQRLRATARGDAKALAPSSSCGREFYPNLFPPRVGDAVRAPVVRGRGRGRASIRWRGRAGKCLLHTTFKRLLGGLRLGASS